MKQNYNDTNKRESTIGKDEYRKRRIIRERYSITSNSYKELYRYEQYEKYASVVFRYSPKGKILDDGCGVGLFIEYLKSKSLLSLVNYFICLDLTRKMLDIAHGASKSLKLDYLIDFLEADAEALPLRDKSIDITYSFTVITLLDHPIQGIKEAKRVSRECVVYSILKRVPSLEIPSVGKYVAETDKDLIFVISQNE